MFPKGASKQRTILVTGGCGYVGSHLLHDLAAHPATRDAVVRILDNMQSGRYCSLMDLPAEGLYQFLEGDILDPTVLRIALEGVDAVIHLAAVVRSPLSFDNSAWTKQVNHLGTIRLVDACLEAGVPRFIYVSSAAVYGPGGPFDEGDPCRPIGPYAQSKRRAEEAVAAAAERGLQATILRLGTVFGLAPTIRFDAVANHFVYLAGVGRALTVYGSGNQRRPLVHVQDACQAILYCLEHSEETVGEVFNVTSSNASVLEVAEAVRANRPSVRIHYTEQDVLNHISFEVSNRRLCSLGWQPEISLEQGLGEMLAHFQSLAGLSQPAQTLED